MSKPEPLSEGEHAEITASVNTKKRVPCRSMGIGTDSEKPGKYYLIIEGENEVIVIDPEEFRERFERILSLHHLSKKSQAEAS